MFFKKSPVKTNRRHSFELSGEIEKKLRQKQKTEEDLQEDYITPSLIHEFFLVDGININRYIKHYQFIASAGSASKAGVNIEAYEFSNISKRPQGYPVWFIAAYPDIVAKLADYTDGAMQNLIEVLYGSSGDDIESKVISSDNSGFSLEALRRIINYYTVVHTDQLVCI